jgi:hypothetical protein
MDKRTQKGVAESASQITDEEEEESKRRTGLCILIHR